MNVDQIYILYLVIIILGSCTSLFQWRVLSKADKYISVLLSATLISEGTAYYFRYRFSNNMYVYHIFSPIELALIACYYQEAIPSFKKWRIGVVVTILGIFMAFINSMYFQPINTFPSLFLLFEGFCIIVLSLLSFYSMLYKDDIKISGNVQFWISAIFLVFWSFTFVIWGSYLSFSTVMQDKLGLIYEMITAINFIIYPGYLVIFIMYRKMLPSGE